MNELEIYKLSLTCNQPELLNAGAGFLLNPILIPGQLATHLYQFIEYRIKDSPYMGFF